MLLHLALQSGHYNHSEQLMLTDLKIICRYLLSHCGFQHRTRPKVFYFQIVIYLCIRSSQLVWKSCYLELVAGGGGCCMTLCHRSDSWLRQDSDRDGFTTQAEVPISYLTEDQDTSTITRAANKSLGSLELYNRPYMGLLMVERGYYRYHIQDTILNMRINPR